MNQHPVFAQVRQRAPKVHCLTNPVTMQDVANVLLAAGGSAVMAQDAAEVEEITTLCDATLLNTGVPSAEKFHACTLASVRANELGHPVVLDPVGAGASAFRRSQLGALLEQVRPTIIRCNQEEAAALLGVRQKQDTAPGQRRGGEQSGRFGRGGLRAGHPAGPGGGVYGADDRCDRCGHRWGSAGHPSRRRPAHSAHHRRRVYALCPVCIVLRRWFGRL